MSFTIIFDVSGAPLEIAAYAPRAGEKLLVGRRRQTMLIWSAPGVDLGARDVRRPVSLGGRFFILGRVRLDAREELLTTLGAAEAAGLASDVGLCLRAYAKWGEECVSHLRGDFSFGIWDETRQLLFCARDQLGVRPLFYARMGNRWLVSDNLENIAVEPGISRDLDSYWIADFLTKGFCLEFERTIYKHINRLQPAHMLSLASRGPATRRYWSLNVQEPIYFRDRRQYLERFRELVSQAIADRMPEGRIGISLSGGLDSSTLAVLAAQVAGDPSRVVAETRYCSHLVPDDEARYSSLVASELGIRLTLRPIDDGFYDPAWRSRGQLTAEPSFTVLSAEFSRVAQVEMMSLANVWLLGEGPDNALTFEWSSYLRWLKNMRDWPRLARAGLDYVRHKEMREWASSVHSRMRLQRVFAKDQLEDVVHLLDECFAKEVDLEERLSDRFGCDDTVPHPWRPRAMASFRHPLWQNYFESGDPAYTGMPLEWRYPYADLRVLTFMLSVPPIPWARRKLLIRKAMQDFLPREILTRDKAPLIGNPLAILLEKNPLSLAPRTITIRRYVNLDKLSAMPQNRVYLLNVYILDHWLQSRGYH